MRIQTKVIKKLNWCDQFETMVLWPNAKFWTPEYIDIYPDEESIMK